MRGDLRPLPSRRVGLLLIAAISIASCVVEDGGIDTEPIAPTTSSTDQSADRDSVVSFATWAEDSFEVSAYTELVNSFEQQTGIRVEMDLTANELPFEELGR